MSKSYFIFLFCNLLLVASAFAQEEMILDSIPEIQRETGISRPSIEKPLLFDDSFSMDEINLRDLSLFSQPLLPEYNKNLDFLHHLNSSGLSTESFSMTGFGISPFFSTANIFNQATYKLNDRLSVGGNSFGIQSAFDQPKLNPTIQEMSTRGASMFLQYKITDKFKVETRFSITNHRSPWEP
ncbi:MAG TPA: hypothetical protein VFC65_00210 [Prolixibacteraceae bacterium]|nr:hypothetical protein [Prolixibacteraceae bacterium]